MHDGKPPPEPKAKTDPDRYRAAVLAKATAGETPEDVRRMFASWVLGRDPDWGGRSGGVTDFAAAVPRWIEARNLERKRRPRGALRPLISEREADGTAENPASQGAGGLVTNPHTEGGADG